MKFLRRLTKRLKEVREMPKYLVRFHPRIKMQLAQHAEVIARVSVPTARRFRSEFALVLEQLAKNPYQFPYYDDPNLPPERYRKCLFAKWYKAAVVDGRSDYQKRA